MRQPVVWISVILAIGLMVIITVSLVKMPQVTPTAFPADRGSQLYRCVHLSARDAGKLQTV